jgi:hypothetical protein
MAPKSRAGELLDDQRSRRRLNSESDDDDVSFGLSSTVGERASASEDGRSVVESAQGLHGGAADGSGLRWHESRAEASGEEEDLSQRIAGIQLLLELTERSLATTSGRRLFLCGTSHRVRASRPTSARAAGTALSVRQSWRIYVSMLDPQFFYESTLLVGGRTTAGARATGTDDTRQAASRGPGGRGDAPLSWRRDCTAQSYAALGMNEENNEDIAEIFKKKWACKAIRGQPLNAYAQLRACAGQIARFCITLGLVDATRVCERGALLNRVCEMQVVQGFVGFWQARALCSTVYSKVCQLKVLVHEAWSFFSMKGEELRKHKAREVHEYILSVAAAEKTETRRISSGRRELDVRAQQGRLFLPSDFDM